MNSDERIRRAEEIYNRRRNQNLGSSYRSTHIYGNEKKRNRPLRKLIMQIIFCVIIYVSILVVKNCDYIFTQEFLNNVKSILNYNVELEKYYNKATNFFNGTDVENNQETITNTIENENQINTQETENIGGANEMVLDGYNGYLFEKDNIEELENIFAKCINDYSGIEQIKNNSTHIVNSLFTREIMIEKYIQFINLL